VAQKLIVDAIDNSKCTQVWLWAKKMLLRSGIVLYQCLWWVLMFILSICVWLCIFYVYML